ncbi:hypothetical protein T07_6970 [Trichinella nelsoni]|uniref:Uncharacterized protein n=1 Tax=Trichinella nelsoni TaxID=6336 RepID=A0A0V0RXY8_9BILA|nr:hypothetical protein T07_6970 [Trichinella nelsoni]
MTAISSHIRHRGNGDNFQTYSIHVHHRGLVLRLWRFRVQYPPRSKMSTEMLDCRHGGFYAEEP